MSGPSTAWVRPHPDKNARSPFRGMPHFGDAVMLRMPTGVRSAQASLTGPVPETFPMTPREVSGRIPGGIPPAQAVATGGVPPDERCAHDAAPPPRQVNFA